MANELKDGDVVSSIVRIAAVTAKKDRNGKDFVHLMLDDGKNKTPGYVWDPSIFDFKKDQILKVKCKVGFFNEKLKFDVLSAEKSNEEIKLASITEDERKYYTDRFHAIKDSITDKDYSVAMGCIFDDATLWEMFSLAPAAVNNHENYRGGLLKHTVEVTERCLDEYNRNPANLNRDLLICGAFMHDFGKIIEYQWETSFDRTTPGKLVGHIQIANIMLGRRLPEGFPSEKAMLIYHLIISHQGKKEWGSPIEPSTKEALVVHYADMMRSYTIHFDEMMEKNQNQEWSEYDKVFGRPWYLKSSGD